MSTNLFMPV